jgi:hypothetical protein
MKTIEIKQIEHAEMTEGKKIQILALINQHWDDFYTASELASYLENGFIFGEFGDNEHYKRDEFMLFINEVELEKNPLPEPEVVEEETIIEETITEE